MKILLYFFILILFICNIQLVNADVIDPKFTKSIKVFWINKNLEEVPEPINYNNQEQEEKNINDLILTKENGKYGFKDKNNNWEIKPQFDYALDFSENLALACIKDNCGFIDEKGKWVINPKFPMPICTIQLPSGEYKRNTNFHCSKPFYYSYFKNGLAPIYYELRQPTHAFARSTGDNYLCGYTNKKGEIIIKGERLSLCGYFSEGLAPVSYGRIRYFYIDKNGEMINSVPFADVTSFKNGVAEVKQMIYIPRKIKNVKTKSYDN